MFLLSIVTADQELKENCFVESETLKGLQTRSLNMVKNNPEVIGKKYSIYKDGVLVKQDIING